MGLVDRLLWLLALTPLPEPPAGPAAAGRDRETPSGQLGPELDLDYPRGPNSLWAAGWEPADVPPEVALAVLDDTARACLGLDPLDVAHADSLARRLGRAAPYLRTLVAARATTYREKVDDRGTGTADGIASALWLLGDAAVALARAEAGNDPDGPARHVGRFATASVRYHWPPALFGPAEAVARAGWRAGYVARDLLTPNDPPGDAPLVAAARTALRLAATHAQAVAAGLPAFAAALHAGELTGAWDEPPPDLADGRVALPVGARVRAVAAVGEPELLEAALTGAAAGGDVHAATARGLLAAWRPARAARDVAVGAFRAHQPGTPHADPPPQAYDDDALSQVLDGARAVAAVVEPLVVSPGGDEPLRAALADAVLAARRLEVPRYRYDDDAFAAEGALETVLRLAALVLAPQAGR